MESTYRHRETSDAPARSGPAVEDWHEGVNSVGIRAAVRRVLSARPEAGAVAAVGGGEGWGARMRRGPRGLDGGHTRVGRWGARMRRALRELDGRHPELSRWVGGRLDIEIPAIAVSLGVHGALLLTLATAGYAVHTESSRELQSQVVAKELSNELTHSDFQDLDQGPEPPTMTPQAGSFSPNLAATTVSAPPDAAIASPTSGAGPGAVELASLDVRRATDLAVPTAS